MSSTAPAPEAQVGNESEISAKSVAAPVPMGTSGLVTALRQHEDFEPLFGFLQHCCADKKKYAGTKSVPQSGPVGVSREEEQFKTNIVHQHVARRSRKKHQSCC